MKQPRFFALPLMLMLSMALHAATENIRIMTYNIPYGNIQVSDGNGDNTWAKRCSTIVAYLNDVAPDLIGMQEPVRAELCDIMRGLPNYAMLGTGRDNGAQNGEYTPIIYRTDRFYCLANDTYWLTETPKVHSKVSGSTHYRIATWALFEDIQTGARFLYTNTHLSYDSPAVKEAQIRIMKPTMKALQNQYGTSLPHFLTGDFNMKDYENVSGENSEACQGGNYQLCLNLGVTMKDAWVQAKTKAHYSQGINAPASRIDYIFVSRTVSCRQARWDNRQTPQGYIMSDHDPLWADVYFTTSVEDNARAAIRQALSETDSTYVLTPQHIKLVTTATQLTTDGTQGTYGVSNLLDNNSATYCLSSNGVPPNQPHYLQVELKRDITDCRFLYCRRTDNPVGVDDRWLDILVTASDDGSEWDYIATFNNFGFDAARTVISDNISLHRPYKYLRFNVMHTPGETLRNGNPQFALSEFQLYENAHSDESPRTADAQVAAAADALEALIATTREKIADGTVKRADVTALQEATAALRQARQNHETGIKVVHSSESRVHSIYDLGGRRQPSLQPGVNILQGADGTTRKVFIPNNQ